MKEELAQTLRSPVIQTEQYIIFNHFKNEKINSNNAKILSSALKNTDRKQDNHQKNMPVRRSYGKISHNYSNKVQLNNKAQAQDNKLVSDCLVKNCLIQQKWKSQQKKQKNSKQKMLKIHPVDVRKYHQQKHLQEIQDAYYRVQQVALQSKNRQQQNKLKIQRVKALSRSKSKQLGNQFRNKQKANLELIKQTIKMKQDYRNIKIPRIMGTLYNDVENNIQSNLIFPIASQVSQKLLQQSKTTRIFMSTKDSNSANANGKKSHEKQTQTKSQQSSSLSKSNLIKSQLKFSTETKPFKIYSQVQQKNQKRLNQQKKLQKFLNKCKSQKDFKQIERRRIIKQGFIQNWEQGPYKKNQDYDCKYSQKIKEQKKKIYANQKEPEHFKIINNKQLLDHQNNPFSRHQMIKNYQNKFLESSRKIPILSSK